MFAKESPDSLASARIRSLTSSTGGIAQADDHEGGYALGGQIDFEFEQLPAKVNDLQVRVLTSIGAPGNAAPSDLHLVHLSFERLPGVIPGDALRKVVDLEWHGRAALNLPLGPAYGASAGAEADAVVL